MSVDVIEFELECVTHGAQRIVAPQQAPPPGSCPRCGLPIIRRRERRRFRSYGDGAEPVGPEAWIG